MGMGTSRRAVLSAGAAAAGAALVAGCSEYGDESGDGAEEPAPSASPPAESPDGSSPTAGEPPADGKELAKTADIPVGGGKIFEGEKVVVTQPEAGTFKAFSAVCTHQGCTVSSVEDGTINCACHGSKYRVADASVENGPATKPLPARQITVESNSIRLT
ncbi:Rieske (2Fe-2S) protein [Streptomyces sp. ISL-98]|uniref:Rieske (2Fe-2S) protein n=1 Tax=Streptomyces sp. ISL-98 TaxID=2819192 RepID=UPI001BE6946C|nr:Rieske (2Fe-2S) protein [Streptomyces sp. ISL-98]MBT2508306.1 Rieske (2Fe-2S) protein [Streptomyces sp. ISL-98]